MQSTLFSHVFINEIVHRTARQKAIIIISYTIQDKEEVGRRERKVVNYVIRNRR